MSSHLIIIGVILLIVAILFIITGLASGGGKTKVAIGGFIGPLLFKIFPLKIIMEARSAG